MDQGTAHHCRDFVDGRHALSAAAVRVPLRRGDRIETVRDIQTDGTPFAEGDYQSRDDRDMAGGALPGVVRSLVFGRMVAWKASAGSAAVGRPRFFRPLREGFRRRSKRPKAEILSNF